MPPGSGVLCGDFDRPLPIAVRTLGLDIERLESQPWVEEVGEFTASRFKATIGVDFQGHSWLIQPLSFFFVATIIVTWQAIPFVAFTVFAGLTQVPNEVLEAAEIDGATGWQRFRLIVLPYLRGVLVILLILQIIWDMRVFSQIYALQTVGGIAAETNTIGVYIFKVSIGAGDLGAGGAISVLLVVLMLALSGYYIRSLLKQEES